MGNDIFRGLTAPKAFDGFSKKICTVDYVGDPTPHANVGVNRFKGACLRMREVVAVRRLFFSFFRSHAHRYRTARWTDQRYSRLKRRVLLAFIFLIWFG